MSRELLIIAAELIERLCDEDDLVECLSFEHTQLAQDIIHNWLRLKWHEEYRKEVVNGQ